MGSEEGTKNLEASSSFSEEEKRLIPIPEKIVTTPEKGRDHVLEVIQKEKNIALIKAWEENEKAKVDNKACKKKFGIGSWEKTKRSSVEAELKKIEEELEKTKAVYRERMKNKTAEIHKEAEEKRAIVEAKKGEEFQKIEERAEKFRATGYPKKLLGCFSY